MEEAVGGALTTTRGRIGVGSPWQDVLAHVPAQPLGIGCEVRGRGGLRPQLEVGGQCL